MSEGGETSHAVEPEAVVATDKPGASKKTNNTAGNKISQYNRLKIMNHLMEKGYDSRSCSTIVRKFKVDANEAEKFINEKAQAAQDHVHEECDSSCYKNINSWLEYYKDKNYHKEANYESALIMLAIADMENHPDPGETGGVDFQQIYRFLGDVMLGNPTHDLNSESKNYLGKEFENLISMANTTEGDKDAKDLYTEIKTKTREIHPQLPAGGKKHRKEVRSVDPLGISQLLALSALGQKPN